MLLPHVLPSCLATQQHPMAGLGPSDYSGPSLNGLDEGNSEHDAAPLCLPTVGSGSMSLFCCGSAPTPNKFETEDLYPETPMSTTSTTTPSTSGGGGDSERSAKSAQCKIDVAADGEPKTVNHADDEVLGHAHDVVHYNDVLASSNGVPEDETKAAAFDAPASPPPSQHIGLPPVVLHIADATTRPGHDQVNDDKNYDRNMAEPLQIEMTGYGEKTHI
eukprot:GHVS01003708.1.p1 GENE.GHVS01003708.1~~GHVS01003708.1.p1  ORF type:complete len:218 (+),score=46.42 GHVS01003708.1:196-849(+)